MKLPVADIIDWDVDNWSRCLPFWHPWVAGLNTESSRVLVLGERKGGLSLWLALLGFSPICTDYRLPSHEAKALHQQWKVSERVTYAAVNVFDMPYLRTRSTS